MSDRPLTPCLVWSGSRGRHYGRIPYGPVVGHRRRVKGVHRFVWEEAHGPLLPGEKVLHHCDNPPCYRLSHLFKGSLADNNADMVSKGRNRAPSGVDHGMAKLTASQVLTIRKLYARGGSTLRSLAADFNVGPVAIHRIVTRKRWKAVA